MNGSTEASGMEEPDPGQDVDTHTNTASFGTRDSLLTGIVWQEELL